MSKDLDHLAARLSARARRAAWLTECARWSAPALYAIGAVVFVARYLGDLSRPAASLALSALLVIPAAAWLRARSRFLSRAGAVAWLDRESGGSGALIAQFDLADERWMRDAEQALARIAVLPRVRVARPFLPSLPAALFVAGALWIAKPLEPTAPSTRIAESALETAEERLLALQEIVELPPEQAEDLAERLRRVEENLRDAPVDASLEALDRTTEELGAVAERSLASAERASGDLARADAAQSASEAQAALQDALKELREGGLAAKLPETIQAELTPGSLELPPGVQLSPEALAKLSGEMRGALDARLAKLANAGLISARQLERATSTARVSEHVCDGNCKRGGT